MKLTPTQKKLVSVFAVVLAGALATFVNSYALHWSTEVQGLIGSVTGGLLLLVKAWGTGEEQEAKLQARVTEAVEREPKL